MKIAIDLNAPTIPTDYSWQEGLGADHAWQFHRIDVCRQLKKAAEELGIRQVRFHGIFNDDMFTYQTMRTLAPVLPKGGPIAEISFRQVADVLDNVLACGVKPFIELSFMPEELASGKKSGLKYKNNITPPKDHAKWAAYITAFIKFLQDRYGKAEVESWWFEVWNEPDLGVFFLEARRRTISSSMKLLQGRQGCQFQAEDRRPVHQRLPLGGRIHRLLPRKQCPAGFCVHPSLSWRWLRQSDHPGQVPGDR